MPYVKPLFNDIPPLLDFFEEHSKAKNTANPDINEDQINNESKTNQTTPCITSKPSSSKVKTYFFYSLIGLATLTAVILVILGGITLATTTHGTVFPILPKFSLWVINTVNPALVAKGITPVLLPILILLAGAFVGTMTFLGFMKMAKKSSTLPAEHSSTSTNWVASLVNTRSPGNNNDSQYTLDPQQTYDGPSPQYRQVQTPLSSLTTSHVADTSVDLSSLNTPV